MQHLRKTTVALCAAGALVTTLGVVTPSASADPAPPIPSASSRTASAATTSVPSTFQMDPMGLGRRDWSGSSYRPVAMTQLLLRRWAPSLAVDGSFGYQTKAAVQAFQRAEGLAVTGTLGRADFYRLFARQTVRYGATGDAVRSLQIGLARGRSLTVDGSFGPATLSAVRNEQATHGPCHGTGVDGIAGPITRMMLFEYEHDSAC